LLKSANMKFANGPCIQLAIEMKNGSLLRSRLSLSNGFICTGADRALLDWLAGYIEGASTPLPLIQGDSFQEKVLQTLQKIPFGKTASYSEVAALCGQPKGARAVGNSCNANPFPLLIPCHRVIRSNGEIGGFALDLEIKKRLLEFEASREDLPR
jgi:methylated-DNA-[protein]-cysteine S-methyltransferase